jgi:hypothetical protein
MQEGQRIWKDCKECLGTGKLYYSENYAYPGTDVSENEIDCPFCDGLGIHPWGWVRGEKEETMPGDAG